MKMKLLSTFILSVLIFVSCDDYTEIDAPVKNATSGNANFSRFYSIGNSITAGYQSGTIYQSGQMYSYGNLIAQRVGTSYEIPYVSDPGLGGRMEVATVSPSFSIYTNPNKGAPLNSNYPLPYNNLGVPGALLYDILYAKSSTTCASFVFSNTPNPYFDFILRGKGQTELEQALSQAPTFLTIWIGNNDVLGYATSGGTSPVAPTNTTQFGQLFGGIAQGLVLFKTQANANFGVAIGNIPNVSAIPFFTTVGLQMAANTSIPWSTLPLGFVFQKAGETGVGSGSASQQDLLSKNVLVTLKASTYASLLGQSTGIIYRGLPGLPAGIDTTKPFGFHPQNPFPNALVLDADEITIANNAVNDFNSIISNTVATLNQQGIPTALVDINSVFNEFIARKNNKWN